MGFRGVALTTDAATKCLHFIAVFIVTQAAELVTYSRCSTYETLNCYLVFAYPGHFRHGAG